MQNEVKVEPKRVVAPSKVIVRKSTDSVGKVLAEDVRTKSSQDVARMMFKEDYSVPKERVEAMQKVVEKIEEPVEVVVEEPVEEVMEVELLVMVNGVLYKLVEVGDDD